MNKTKVVYGWYSKDEIFYVGIGSKKRSKEMSNRNPHCLNKANKAKREKCFSVKYLRQNLSAEEAIESEINFIKAFGRLDLGTGVLTNMTEGGDGVIGYIKTEEEREKISERMSGEKHPFHGGSHTEETKEKIRLSKLGQKHSLETRKKMSESHKGRVFSEESKERIRKNQPACKKVKIDNVIYSSLSEAGKHLGVSYKAIKYRCENINYNNYEFYNETKTLV